MNGFPPSTRRERLAWASFDFANSAFTTVVVTVVFGPYFVGHIVGKDGYAGLDGDTWWGLAGAVSKGLVMLSAPILGAMADRRAQKKRYLSLSWIVCVVATASLATAGPGMVPWALALFLLANLGFALGEGFIAGFLPELVRGEALGRLSGLGAAIGYCGGLVSLAVALVLVQQGLVVWVTVAAAVFFFLAGLPTFLYLRERAVPGPDDPTRSLAAEAFGELRRTFAERARFKDLFRFLLALFFFQAGVEVVVAYSAIYAQFEVRMEKEEIILLFIALQVSAGLGAFGIGHLQDRKGSKTALVLALAVWCAAVFTAFIARDLKTFLIAGVLAGAGMGMSQSAARTVVAQFAPRGREAEWFGLAGFVGKGASVMGLCFYVLLHGATDSRRWAILGTLGLFLVGLALVLRVDQRRGQAAALLASDRAA